MLLVPPHGAILPASAKPTALGVPLEISAGFIYSVSRVSELGWITLLPPFDSMSVFPSICPSLTLVNKAKHQVKWHSYSVSCYCDGFPPSFRWGTGMYSLSTSTLSTPDRRVFRPSQSFCSPSLACWKPGFFLL